MRAEGVKAVERPRWSRRRVAFLIFAGLAAAGAKGAWWASRPSPTRVGSDGWPPALDAAETEAVLRASCEDAARGRTPLLVEFSAPWCDNCRDVKSVLGDGAVSAELERFRSVLVNIGDDRRLDALRLDLGARAIPYWTVIDPARCQAPLAEWRRIASTFPGNEPHALASWLAAARP